MVTTRHTLRIYDGPPVWHGITTIPNRFPLSSSIHIWSSRMLGIIFHVRWTWRPSADRTLPPFQSYPPPAAVSHPVRQSLSPAASRSLMHETNGLPVPPLSQPLRGKLSIGECRAQVRALYAAIVGARGGTVGHLTTYAVPGGVDTSRRSFRH